MGRQSARAGAGAFARPGPERRADGGDGAISGPDGSGGRRPYWLIPIAVALLLIPAAPANVLLAAALAVSVGLSVVRSLRARAASATARGPSADSIFLGVAAGSRQVHLSDRQLSAHALIVGASGAGKSTTMLRILAEQIRRGAPVIAVDMKGSPGFAHQLATAAAAAGRPFRVWTPDGSEQWNPLQHGNATELKDKLISSERFSEPHYQRAAERYVQTVLQVLHESRPGRAPTIRDVVMLMEPRKLGAALRHLPSARAAQVQDYLTSLGPDQLSALRGVQSRLALVAESNAGRYLGADGSSGIDVRAALEGGEVVLFSLNSSRYGRLAAQLGALAVQDLVAATGERLTRTDPSGNPLPPAIVAIDEFSGLGNDNVLSLLARGREAGVTVMVATQEMADLDRAGHGFREQVLGVTAVKIVHRQDVPASARLAAQMIGTHMVWEHTYQIGRGPLGVYSTSRGTRRQVERFLIHPDEIMRLTTGRAVLITKNPIADARIVDVEPPRVTGAARLTVQPSRAPSPAAPHGQAPSPAAPHGQAPKPAAPDGQAPSPAAPRGQAPRPAAPRAELPRAGNESRRGPDRPAARDAPPRGLDSQGPRGRGQELA